MYYFVSPEIEGLFYTIKCEDVGGDDNIAPCVSPIGMWRTTADALLYAQKRAGTSAVPVSIPADVLCAAQRMNLVNAEDAVFGYISK